LALELKAPKHRQARGRGNGSAPDHESSEQHADHTVLHIPWRKTSSKRRREIIVPKSAAPQDTRPIRAETRAKLIASIARGRRWLDEIVTGVASDVEQIAAREKCSVRKVNMIISLAFLAPDLVKAAIEGLLPRGIGVARLCDAPAEWSRQYRMLGLTSPHFA
jgi:site-specific DNA recombinase